MWNRKHSHPTCRCSQDSAGQVWWTGRVWGSSSSARWVCPPSPGPFSFQSARPGAGRSWPSQGSPSALRCISALPSDWDCGLRTSGLSAGTWHEPAVKPGSETDWQRSSCEESHLERRMCHAGGRFLAWPLLLLRGWCKTVSREPDCQQRWQRVAWRSQQRLRHLWNGCTPDGAVHAFGLLLGPPQTASLLLWGLRVCSGGADGIAALTLQDSASRSVRGRQRAAAPGRSHHSPPGNLCRGSASWTRYLHTQTCSGMCTRVQSFIVYLQQNVNKH